MKEKTMEEIIESSPEICLITGLRRCDSYIIDGEVVYLTNPAYDAYTLPIYDDEDKSFSHTKHDLDEPREPEVQHICYLEELKDNENFNEILEFYNIEKLPWVLESE